MRKAAAGFANPLFGTTLHGWCRPPLSGRRFGRRDNAAIRQWHWPAVSRRCGPEGVAMTTTTDGAVAKKSGGAARKSRASSTGASARGPARAASVDQPSRADRVARGKDARAAAPLESHAEFSPAAKRDPVGLLLSQAKSRVPELVPIRHGRMLVSPFTFYRGAALPMAADLAG